MAPRKINKRNRVKIKSKSNKEKLSSKSSQIRKKKKRQKSTDNFKWVNKIPENESYQKSVPRWLREGPFKLRLKSCVSGSNSSNSEKYLVSHEDEEKEEKISGSESSEECNCEFSAKGKKNLKLKSSSTSTVSDYIKTGLDQVASFIVESAIKFGEQRGVVVQNKNNPNLYEFTPTDKKFKDKFRKIWFKVPERGERKLAWRPSEATLGAIMSTSKTTWQEDGRDSLDKILPILKKIKHEEEYQPGNSDAERTESESEDAYEENMSRERVKTRGKREESSESVSSLSDKTYPLSRRKFRRDSLELGRRRLKARSKSKKQESLSRQS